jgi:hypothetical protein
MTRRPAVTLMEVLVAMFIMAIGMLALLALFPVGAVSMAQALKDDRCAYASSFAENTAIANNIRYGDLNVSLVLNDSTKAPTGLVYVDPYGVSMGVGPVGFGFIPIPIQRVRPLFAGSKSLIDRWFSLPDDIGFTLSGTPDVSNTGGIIDRGRNYTIAYLLRRQPSNVISTANPSLSPTYSVQLYAVVYSGRPVNTLLPEVTLVASGAANTNGIVINTTGTTIKRGGWVLDPINGYFYRVTNLAEFGGTTTIEVQQNIVAPITNITIMDYVAEVFDKGVGWQQ